MPVTWFRTACFVMVSCIEDDSRGQGETCFEDADCTGRLVCTSEAWCGTAAEAEALAADADDADTITCNDGTRSPTCTTCSSGCCSSHDGC